MKFSPIVSIWNIYSFQKSKMSENLEELISKEIPDKQKQTLIYEYLEQNQIKDINDCTNIVQVALR